MKPLCYAHEYSKKTAARFQVMIIAPFFIEWLQFILAVTKRTQSFTGMTRFVKFFWSLRASAVPTLGQSSKNGWQS